MITCKWSRNVCSSFPNNQLLLNPCVCITLWWNCPKVTKYLLHTKLKGHILQPTQMSSVLKANHTFLLESSLLSALTYHFLGFPRSLTASWSPLMVPSSYLSLNASISKDSALHFVLIYFYIFLWPILLIQLEIINILWQLTKL